MRRFHLVRDEDVTGISGTGLVAEGVIMSSGKAVIEWLTEWPTSVVWHDRGLDSVEHVHGHNGRTRIEWLDHDAASDRAARAATAHYFSTYCIHVLHESCRQTCKFCDLTCGCECHDPEEAA